MAVRHDWRNRRFLGEMAPMRAFLIAWLLFPLLAFAGVTEHAPKGTFSESCPACLKMARTTFADGAVAERLRQRFVLLVVDIFGGREMVWLDGVARSEKDLAKHLGITGTPTVMILDEQGRSARQFIGYRDARAFQAILDAAAPK